MEELFLLVTFKVREFGHGVTLVLYGTAQHVCNPDALPVGKNSQQHLLEEYIAPDGGMLAGAVVHVVVLHEPEGLVAILLYEIHVTPAEESHIIRCKAPVAKIFGHVVGNPYCRIRENPVHHLLIV